MPGFGGAVKLTGETEYKKALKSITQGLKEVSSEMKLVSSEYSKNDKSTKALSAQSETLAKKLDLQKQKVNVLTNQYKSMSDQYATNAKKLTDLNSKYDAEKAKLAEIGRTLGTTSSEYLEQKKVVDSLGQELKKSTNEQDAAAKSMSNMRIELNNAQTAVNNTQKELDGLDKKLDDVEDGASKAGDGFTVFKGVLSDLAATAIKAMVSGLKDLAGNMVDIGTTFEASMSNVGALSGATAEEMQKLEDTARQYGATTQFSASEAADALGYMALAGWDANTSCSALGGVLDLAAASGMGLAEASDMVTDYLTAFGMSADKSAYFADLLSYAQANSNTTAAALGEAYKNCAANLNAAGQDVETVTSLLAQMANQGYKGSEAGTALSAIMRDITARMKDGSIAIGDTSVAVMDASGNYRDLTDILTDVETATNGMGDAERAAALSATFTADSTKGLNLLLNAGVDSAASFEEQLRNCDGAAADMAATMNDNLQGDLKSLNSAWEEFNLVLYDSSSGAMRDVVQSITSNLIPALTDVVNGVDGAGAELGSAIGDVVNNVLSIVTEALPTILETVTTLLSSIIDSVVNNLPNIISSSWSNTSINSFNSCLLGKTLSLKYLRKI